MFNTLYCLLRPDGAKAPDIRSDGVAHWLSMVVPPMLAVSPADQSLANHWQGWGGVTIHSWITGFNLATNQHHLMIKLKQSMVNQLIVGWLSLLRGIRA